MNGPARFTRKVQLLFRCFLLISVTLCLFLLSACSSMKPQEAVDSTKANESPENVARVFAESLATGDVDLQFLCYPAEFVGGLSSEDSSVYMDYSEQIAVTMSEEGTTLEGSRASEPEPYTLDKDSTEYASLQTAISAKFGVDEDLVSDAKLCAVRLFFNDDQTMDVTVLVYQLGDTWYAYKLQANDDADS